MNICFREVSVLAFLTDTCPYSQELVLTHGSAYKSFSLPLHVPLNDVILPILSVERKVATQPIWGTVP